MTYTYSEAFPASDDRHGEPSGSTQHHRLREDACDECKAAAAKYARERRRKQREDIRIPLPTRTWEVDALCPEIGGDTFFDSDDETTAEASARKAAARAVCNLCTVRAECIEDAIAHDERHGIRGGYDFSVRLSERKWSA